MEIQIRYDTEKDKQVQISCPQFHHGSQSLHYTLFDIPAGTDLDFMAHWHPEYEIVLQLDGYTEFMIDGSLYHVNAGEALFFHGSCVHGHADRYTRYGHYICFSFGEDFLFPDPNSYIYNRFFMPFQSGQYTFTKLVTDQSAYGRVVLPLLQTLFSLSARIPENALSIQICLLRIFEAMLCQNAFDRCALHPSRHELIKSALWYINQNYTSPISVKDISAFLNISPDHFSRLFKAAVGASPKEYMMDLRIRRSIHELTVNPDLSLSEIAFTSGFSDPNYFARAFRTKLGISPSDYLKHIHSPFSSAP